jgi:protein-S-isoprenylcysteine O-methyltransferase Ste14
MSDSLRVFCLGFMLLTIPPAFRSLAAVWYPAEHGTSASAHHGDSARTLRRKFWQSALMVIVMIILVCGLQHLRKGSLALDTEDWLRIAAVTLALTAALGRGGWGIQTWKGTTVVERIDRGMYVIEQLGAASLLIFALTL